MLPLASRCSIPPFLIQVIPQFKEEAPLAMGYWQAALVKMGVAQPGPKITSHDRAVLE